MIGRPSVAACLVLMLHTCPFSPNHIDRRAISHAGPPPSPCRLHFLESYFHAPSSPALPAPAPAPLPPPAGLLLAHVPVLALLLLLLLLAEHLGLLGLLLGDFGETLGPTGVRLGLLHVTQRRQRLWVKKEKEKRQWMEGGTSVPSKGQRNDAMQRGCVGTRSEEVLAKQRINNKNGYT